MSSGEQNASSNGRVLILQQNCREDWPTEVCIFANICGLCSAAIWFVVLFPQLWKNSRRKSVRGLSFLWAVANFTASLVNLFFVFKLKELPVFVKIQAVYQPTMNLVLLAQFWRYSEDDALSGTKLAVLGLCLVGWGALVTVQLTMDVHQELQWVAVVLWSVQTFPQVILNAKLRSTGGQSTKMVLLSLFGKMTDFLCIYLLVLPLQYVIMAYFSSSMCYVNGLQIVWYWGQQGKLADSPQPQRQLEDSSGDTAIPDGSGAVYTAVEDDTDQAGENYSDETMAQTLQEKSAWTLCVRIGAFGGLSLILLGYLAGLIWNTLNPWAVVAPVTILVVLFISQCYLTGINACRNIFVKVMVPTGTPAVSTQLANRAV